MRYNGNRSTNKGGEVVNCKSPRSRLGEINGIGQHYTNVEAGDGSASNVPSDSDTTKSWQLTHSSFHLPFFSQDALLEGSSL